MEDIPYKDFSRDLHEKVWRSQRPVMAQIELTYKCNLNCQHCYTKCFDNDKFVRKQLNTKDIKKLLDNLYKDNIFWICFTGGEPLMREDFLEIYTYAKEKGFIITILTNATLIDKPKIDCFKKMPPFCVEVTLNAINQKTYKNITGINVLTEAIKGINKLIENNISVKIKTQITKQNYDELGEIRKFVEKKGKKLRISTDLHTRLNKDKYPTTLRISPEKLAVVDREYKDNFLRNKAKRLKEANKKENKNKLFSCNIGLDTVFISPEGKMFLCYLMREFFMDALTGNIRKKFKKLINTSILSRNNVPDFKCISCTYRSLCDWCPPKTKLEKREYFQPIPYYCKFFEILGT